MKSQKMAQFHDVINPPWLIHNHPSGAVQPSAEDRRLTRTLRDALALVDVRLLDHVVVGKADTFSFARAGWL